MTSFFRISDHHFQLINCEQQYAGETRFWHVLRHLLWNLWKAYIDLMDIDPSLPCDMPCTAEGLIGSGESDSLLGMHSVLVLFLSNGTPIWG